MKETDVHVIHGFSIDDLGTTTKGESNETAIGNAPVMSLYFNVVELVFSRDSLAGSITLSVEYNDADIETINRGLSKEHPGIYTITENDLALYYFDKSRGEFTLCGYSIDRANKKFVVTTQIPGIYVLALKPETYGKMAEYFESNPQAAGAAQKSIAAMPGVDKVENVWVDKSITAGKSDGSTGMVFQGTGPVKNIGGSGGLVPDGYAPEPPRNVKEWGDWNDTNCSAPNEIEIPYFKKVIPIWLAKILYQNFGDRPFYYHDFCYRYGRGTYNNSRKSCDDKMLSDFNRAIDDRYGFKGVKGRRIKIGYKNYWIPNPAYIAWKIVTFPLQSYLYSCAYSAYKIVRVAPEAKDSYMDDSTANKISGCYDYAGRGKKCEIARINTIVAEQGSGPYISGDTVSLRAIIFANQDSGGVLKGRMGLQERRMDRIEWSLTPFSTGLSVLNSSSSPFTSWTLPADITPGRYAVRADLFDDAGLISSQSAALTVSAQKGTITVSSVLGGSYPDYASSADTDPDGNVFMALCYTGTKTIVTGSHRECRTEWCWSATKKFRCTRCTTVADYGAVPVRTGRVAKYTSSMDLLWALDFPDKIIESIAPGTAALHVLTLDGDLVTIGSSGGITKSEYIGLAGWDPFKVLADQYNNVYVLYAKDGSGFRLRKWDDTGFMTEEITGMEGSTVNDVRLAYNAIYIASYSGGLISVEKYDLNLTFQWLYSENITGEVVSGSIDVVPDGSSYITGMGPSSIILGSGRGHAYFVSKLDLFGNVLWRSGMNGAAASVLPAPSAYHLAGAAVPPVVRAGADSKAYVLSAPGLSVRTVGGDGDFEKIRAIPVHSGTAYYRGMFINPSGRISIYGSTDGKIRQGDGSFGALDWFYLETENY